MLVHWTATSYRLLSLTALFISLNLTPECLIGNINNFQFEPIDITKWLLTFVTQSL